MSTELLPVTELSPSERSFELQQALYRSKGIEVDVFGVPVAEAERELHGEVRVVPITDEILAAEAAADAARQTDREKLTWHMPEPLPDTAYRPRPGKRRVRRAVAPKPPREPKAAKPLAPPPSQVHKEEPPMEKHLEEKTCIVSGCNGELKPNNKSGQCAAHPYLKRGTVLKDGTVIGSGHKTNEPAAKKKATAKEGVSSAPPLSYKIEGFGQDGCRHHRRGRGPTSRSRIHAHRLLASPGCRRQGQDHLHRAAERTVR